MFRFLILAIIMFSVTSTAKNEGTTSVDEICEMFGRIAEGIIAQRQLDISISTVMEFISSAEGPEDQKQTIRKLVLLAYEQPSYTTKSIRDEETRKFRNLVEVTCFKKNYNK